MPQHQGLNQKIIDRYNLWSSDAFDRGCETNKLCQTMFMVMCLVHYSFTTKYYLQFARLTYSWQYCRMNQFRVEDSMNVWRHSFRGDRFRQTETYFDEDSDICNISCACHYYLMPSYPQHLHYCSDMACLSKSFNLPKFAETNPSVWRSITTYLCMQSGRGSVVWLTHVFVPWSQRGRQTEANTVNKFEDVNNWLSVVLILLAQAWRFSCRWSLFCNRLRFC